MIQSKTNKLPGDDFDISLEVTVFGATKPAVLSAVINGVKEVKNWIELMSRIYFVRNFMVYSSAIVTAMTRSGDPLRNAFATKISKCIDDVRMSTSLKDMCASFQLCSKTLEEGEHILSNSPDQFEKAAGKFVKECYEVLNTFAAKVVK